jgi:hypothetical protein
MLRAVLYMPSNTSLFSVSPSVRYAWGLHTKTTSQQQTRSEHPALPFMLKIRAVIRFTNMQWMNRTRDLDFWKIWETYWNSNTLRSYWEHVPFTIGANIAPFHNTWYKCCSDVLWGLRKRRECICKNLKILWEFQQFALLLRTLSVYVAITSRARSDPITYVAKTCSARAQRMI